MCLIFAWTWKPAELIYAVKKVPVTSWGSGQWLTRKGMGALQIIQITHILIGFVVCECFHQKFTNVYENMCISSHINFTCKCKNFYYEVKHWKTNKEPNNLETEIGLIWSSGSSIGNVRWWANLSILLQCILVRYLDPWDHVCLERIVFTCSFLWSVGVWLSWKVHHLDFTVIRFTF